MAKGYSLESHGWGKTQFAWRIDHFGSIEPEPRLEIKLRKMLLQSDEINLAHFLESTRTLFAIAPPVNGLNVVRVIIPPSPAHTFGMDVVGDDVAIVGELLLAEGANALLDNDLPIKKFPHFTVRAEFPVSPWMVCILDTANAHLALTPFSGDCFSSTAEEGAVDRAELIPVESHVTSWLATVEMCDWRGVKRFEVTGYIYDNERYIKGSRVLVTTIHGSTTGLLGSSARQRHAGLGNSSRPLSD